MSKIKINDYFVNYNISGSGPCLILLHDGFYSTQSWDGVRADLARHFTVIDYDRFGYGKSTHLEEFDDLIIEFGVRELEEFVSKLELKQFFLCGHCLGAAVSLVYAAKNPEKVLKIIAESVGMHTDPKILNKCDWIFQPFEYLAKDFQAELIKMHGEEYAKILWHFIRNHKRSYIMNENYDIRQKVRKIKSPIFFIYGDRDFYFDLDHAKGAYKLFRQSQLWIVPNTNHVAHREKKEDFLKNVIRFLSD